MVYTEKAIFKRDIKERENGKKTTQIRVTGLSVNSKFKDNEEIIILSKEDFIDLETQLSTKDDKIRELENQLKQSKNETKESPKYINKVLELQEEINNRNQLLFNTQNTINNIFTEINTANNTSKDKLITLISELQTTANTILGLSEELQNQTGNINDGFKKVGWLEWIRNKNKINIVLDTDKLTELEAKLTEFTNNDIVQLANTLITPMEIPTDNLDLNELYISTGNDTANNEIVITPPDNE